jgi:sporulation protein YlmC with PRC-barrel domain
MLKKLLIATAAGGLMMSTALAQQTAPAPGAPAAAPPAATPAAPKMDDKAKADSAAAVMKDGKFVAAQNADQWAWSKFKGTDVIGPSNEKIGDVDDILFDKDGKVHAFIVGVGGFLGIGQKDVAIDMSAFQVVPADSVRTTARDTGTTGTTVPAPATVASDPTDIKLKVSWTKEQLKEAPAFAYYKAPARTTGSAPGTAPRPAGSTTR